MLNNLSFKFAIYVNLMIQVKSEAMTNRFMIKLTGHGILHYLQSADQSNTFLN